MRKIKYEDLKLGEKAKESFLSGTSFEELNERSPIYLNTRPVVAGLNVTDLAIAGVLGGLNMILAGKPGCGKSQLAHDIHNYYFGGNVSEHNGHAVSIRGYDGLDLYAEHYAMPQKSSDGQTEKFNLVPNMPVIRALFHHVDEINRCHGKAQNQFLAIGDGSLLLPGTPALRVGDETTGYHTGMATANMENGDFVGVYQMDPALLNRFIVLDLNKLKPRQEDLCIMDHLNDSDANVKETPRQNGLVPLILQANAEIRNSTRNLGIEASAAIDYLTMGLANCRLLGEKDEELAFSPCQTCKYKDEGSELSICSQINPLPIRTKEALKKYVASLDYLAKLKNPNIKVNPADLVFKAFEFVGANQGILNPYIVNGKYAGRDSRMLVDISEKLKSDFVKNQDYICTAIEAAREEGREVKDFYQTDFQTEEGQISVDFSGLPEHLQEKVTKIESLHNDRPVGLGWVTSARVPVELACREARIKREKAKSKKSGGK